jgi:hypothetical protein
MARPVNDFNPLLALYFGGASVELYSGLLAPGGNTPVVILVSAVLRFSTRGDC